MTDDAKRPGAISLDQLIALNDEIAALARSGMPLERGLMGVGGDLPGRLGAIARGLGARMERGVGLDEALDQEGPGLPPTYRAVVAAGLRSGRLAEALEGLAGFARGYVELRRAIGLALLYPMIVMVVAYGLFIVFLVELIPRIREAYSALRVPLRGPIVALEGLGRSVPAWGPILPLAILAGLALWVRSGRASAFRPGAMGRGLRWLPGLKGIFEGATAGQFAEWLAILIEHGVPWDEAVTLAADATGDPRIVAAARDLAEASRRGESRAEPTGKGAEGAFPPLLAWVMASERSQTALVPALRHAGQAYRRRSMRKAARLRAALPSALLLILGGSAAFLYTMTLFVPWTTLLSGLSKFE